MSCYVVCILTSAAARRGALVSCVLVMYVILLFVLKLNGILGVCDLSLTKDFGKPSPVYLRNGEFLQPEVDSGQIKMRKAETLQVGCPGRERVVMMSNYSSGLDVVNLKCVRNTTFQAAKGSWVGELNEVTCNGSPWFTAEETAASCPGGHNIYRIGYKINDKFHGLYEACFDRGVLNTVYVKQVLSPSSRHTQLGARPQFIEGGLFESERMSTLYKMEHQKRRLDALLGGGLGQKYVTKTQYISRGHLAARADFSLRAQQRASFHYINVAPQWQRGNAGDWAALEEALRRRVFDRGSPVTVYTGTYGVSTLPDVNDVDRQLYLDVDSNNNGIVPVPLYFYKVVHDETNRTGVAFVSINSSYYNASTTRSLTFCDDVCERSAHFKWLRWRPRDGTHSFCCEYEQFVSKIDNLPKLNVRGLFY